MGARKQTFGSENPVYQHAPYIGFDTQLLDICRLIDFLKPFMLRDWARHMQIQLAHIPPHGKH